MDNAENNIQTDRHWPASCQDVEAWTLRERTLGIRAVVSKVSISSEKV